MKIRHRLSLLFVLCSTISLLLCGTLLLRASAKSTVRSAQDNALSELAMLETSFSSAVAKSMGTEIADAARRSLLVYVFQSYAENTFSGSQYVLKHGRETLYNNSGYAPDAILGDLERNTVTWQKEKLFAAVTETELLRERYQIYLVRNMTSVYDSIEKLQLQFAVICLLSVLVSAALILHVTSRTLCPLKQLEKGAAAMAAGAYHARIPLPESVLTRMDEIATVSKSFNHMADAVERQIEAVTAVAEERKMLIGALTHEMKTPMTAIIGYAESLDRAKLTEEQREEAVSFIHREAKRLERLTQKMMQLITLTDGEDIVLQDVSARQLFDETEKTLEAVADRYDAVLRYMENGEHFAADADLIAGVLINLVDNTCSAGAKHITISAEENVLSVSDDGRGIPQEIIGKVTQPFFRADKARSRKGGHAGLGLALAVRIAKLHQAQLIIESTEEKGTTVSLIFSR
ncbi:MAG: HAMP domain-containing histidine kinase [Clostridia bacterium]|nr:HAMP domain-containing histidine kinase [Clostridia bacterium]